MSKSIVRATVVALALCAVMAVALPAHAADRGLVPYDVYVGSVNLRGMDETAALAAISREASVTLLPKLKVSSAGSLLTLDTPKYLKLDVAGMLDRAYAAETTVTIPRMAIINDSGVDKWVANAARNRKPKDARYYVSHGRLRWSKAANGRSLLVKESAAAVKSALRKEIASGAAQGTVALPYKTVIPKVTDRKLGRAILVDLSQRKLRLYDHSKVKKTVGVAVGMSRYPTPRGKFKIVAKSAHPAWRNPGSGWAANMPAYIPPGPTNPLGLRALYLNAPGIRIHGTHKTYSIGTAASHGCMRVANSKIVKLYPMVPVGTPVFIVK